MKTKDTNDLIEIMDQIRRITNTLAEKDMEIRLLRQENERLYKMISEMSKPTLSDPEPRYRHSWIKDPYSPTFTCGSSSKIH